VKKTCWQALCHPAVKIWKKPKRFLGRQRLGLKKFKITGESHTALTGGTIGKENNGLFP